MWPFNGNKNVAKNGSIAIQNNSAKFLSMTEALKGNVPTDPMKVMSEVLAFHDDYLVLEMGQSLAHELWYIQMAHRGDLFGKVPNIRRVWTEEHDTLEEAIVEAGKKISNKDFVQNQPIEESDINIEDGE